MQLVLQVVHLLVDARGVVALAVSAVAVVLSRNQNEVDLDERHDYNIGALN